MPFARAGQLARPTPSVRPDDSIGLVAENLRESRYGAIPVLDRVVLDDPEVVLYPPEEGFPRLLGLIDERDLSRAALPLLEHQELQRRENFLQEAAVAARASSFSAEADGETSDWMGKPFPGSHLNGNGAASSGENSVKALTARQIMRTDVGIVPASFSLHNTLLTLDRYDASALPVLDDIGNYRGMISRADVLAALGEQVRPPMVGGMATPLGVWLTTGSINGGVKPLGLFLSGLVLGGCHLVSDAIMQLGLNAINEDWGRLYNSGRLGAAASGGLLNFIVTVLQGLLFLLAMRALPMSGIHAAEHQTVWAIEKGLPLTPENVKRMPRAHPRCGTNLVVLAGLIQIVFAHLPEFTPQYILFSLLFIYFTWRRFGTAVQEYLTTKPATQGQLESGIRAGREVLEKYQSLPHVPLSFGMRLLNSGLLLSMGGFILVEVVYEWLKDYWATAYLG